MTDKPVGRHIYILIGWFADAYCFVHNDYKCLNGIRLLRGNMTVIWGAYLEYTHFTDTFFVIWHTSLHCRYGCVVHSQSYYSHFVVYSQEFVFLIYSPSYKSLKCKLLNTWNFIFYAFPILVFWAVFVKKNGLRSVWTSCIVGTLLGHCMPKLNLHYCFWFIKFCQVVLKMKHPSRYNLTIML